MGVCLPNFKERQVEKRAKPRKMLSFYGFKGNSPNLSVNGKNIPHFTILTQNT